jgi:hypothetical protein
MGEIQPPCFSQLDAASSFTNKSTRRVLDSEAGNPLVEWTA